jgi:hypothetical protein
LGGCGEKTIRWDRKIMKQFLFSDSWGIYYHIFPQITEQFLI